VAPGWIVAAPAACHADSIFTDDRVIHGRILSLNSETLVFEPGCAAENKETLAWSAVSEIVFNSNCNAPSLRLPSAGGGLCAQTPRRRFLIYFHDRPTPLIADGVTLTADRVLHFDDQSSNLRMGHGPVDTVRGIARRMVCPGDTSRMEAPPQWCVEPKRFAVNFSYDTPVDNRVLTRGFSFFLETEPERKERQDELRELIRAAFGTALTSWMSELWARRANYDLRLQTFLEGLMLRSPTYMMLVPPQVISLDCPHAATFIVRLFYERKGPFAAQMPKKAAFAQKPGRTLLLNFADYECWRHAYFQFVLEPGTRCVNLVPILTHELGHSLGLGHVQDDDSIMTELVHKAAPSPGDADRLAAKLLESIQGDRPGVFEFVGADGIAVEAPTDGR
jgi:hypothetical protein